MENNMLVPTQGQIAVFQQFDRFVQQFGGAGAPLEQDDERALTAWRVLDRGKGVSTALVIQIIQLAGMDTCTFMLRLNKRYGDVLANGRVQLFRKNALQRLGNIDNLALSRVRQAIGFEDHDVPIFHERRLATKAPVPFGNRHELSIIAFNVYCCSMPIKEILETANRIDPEAMKPSFLSGLRITVIRLADIIINNSVIEYITLCIGLACIILPPLACLLGPFGYYFGADGILVGAWFNLVVIAIIGTLHENGIQLCGLIPFIMRVASFTATTYLDMWRPVSYFVMSSYRSIDEYLKGEIQSYQNERLRQATVVWERECLRRFNTERSE